MRPDLHIDRRQFLGHLSLGGLALNEMLANPSVGGASSPLSHHRPRAKNVIMLFMCGGTSHLETFDHKPQLKKWAGKKASEIFRKDDLEDSTRRRPSRIARSCHRSLSFSSMVNVAPG